MSGNKNVLLGVALIVGAYLYTRSQAGLIPGAPLVGAAAAGSQPLGTGSMPGSVGTGIAQTVGGLLGNLIAPQSGGGTANGTPVPLPNSLQPQTGDNVAQNNACMADPLGTYDPTLSGGLGSGDSLMNSLGLGMLG